MSRATQDTMLRQLKQPFDPKFVKWRVGATNEKKENGRVIQKATKGIALAYIDSREVMKRLDDVCGLGGWQAKYVPMDGGFICELSILIDGQWVTKSNAAGNTHVEPVKGGASDALKRAAATWGVGRYLYYLPNVWVPVNEYKQLVSVPELPDWALPSSQIERWEDVAEMEAAENSGADNEVPDTVVEELDEDIAGSIAKAYKNHASANR